MSESEIMTVLVCYHFGTYRTFKDYYLNSLNSFFQMVLNPQECGVFKKTASLNLNNRGKPFWG